MHPRRTTGMAILVGLAFTLAAAAAPPVSFAHRSAEAKVALDTAEALIAFLTALLLFGRLRQGGGRAEALLVYSMLIFGGANLLFGVVPDVLSLPFEGQGTTVWAPLAARLIGAVTLVVAAFSPHAGHGSWAHAGWTLVGAAAVTLVAVWAVSASLSDALPVGVPAAATLNASRPRITGHPMLLGAQLAAFALFAAAAWGFTVRAQRDGDALMQWVGAGVALGAIARVNYFIFPSIYTDYVYTGDILRLGFYLMLLTGSALEIRRYWQRLQEMALTDALTGLNNRHGFETLAEFQLRVARRERRSVALVFVDLNDMKGINDTLGHDEGDRALLDTAGVLRATFREVDVLGRLGGDEFCVLLADAADATGAVERLQANVIAFRDAHPRPYVLSLSAGVAVGSEPLPELLARADEEMYRDKVSRKQNPGREAADPAG